MTTTQTSSGRRPLIAGIAALLVLAGVLVRLLVWEASGDLRSFGDMHNRWEWGRIAAEHGVVEVIGRSSEDLRNGVDMRFGPIDYMPTRLLAMEGWYRFSHPQFPQAREWQPGLAFNLPLLMTTMVGDLVASVLAALLAFGLGGRRAAFLAASAVWLNPLVIAVGYVPPQMDNWSLPFCLGALFLLVRRRWGLSGAVLAAGATIKAQLLVFAPFLLLVLLLKREPAAAARWVLGFAAVAIALMLPWWLQGDPLAPFRVGILYGVEKFDGLARPFVQNLPALATHLLELPEGRPLAFAGVHWDTLFSLAATACSLFAAWLARRHPMQSLPFLLAATLPWLGFYLFAPRVFHRYLIWGVVLLCVPAAVSPRLFAAMVVLSIVGATSLLVGKFANSGLMPPAIEALAAASPHGGWLALASFAVVAWALRSPRQPPG